MLPLRTRRYIGGPAVKLIAAACKGVLGTLIALAIWWLVTSMHLVPKLLLPTPVEVWEAAQDAAPTLGIHAFASFLRLVTGFASGLLAGYGLGLSMVMFRGARSAIGPMVDSSRSAPTIAVLPFFLLWFGLFETGETNNYYCKT